MTIPTVATGIKVFTPTECKQIIELCSPLVQTSSIIDNGKKQIEKKNIRQSKSIGLAADNPKFKPIQPLLSKAVDALIHISQVNFHCTPVGVDPIQFASYEPNDYYQFHIDSSVEIPRSMSASVLLSSPLDFKNGDLCFRDLESIDEQEKKPNGVPISLQQGEIVVFPSLLMHQILPITEGIRHSLVLWSFTEEMLVTRNKKK